MPVTLCSYKRDPHGAARRSASPPGEKVKKSSRHSRRTAEKRHRRKKVRVEERAHVHQLRIETGMQKREERIARHIRAKKRHALRRAVRVQPSPISFTRMWCQFTRRRERWVRYLERCARRGKVVHHQKTAPPAILSEAHQPYKEAVNG